MKDTLVIGSNGYIGSAVYSRLQDIADGLDIHNGNNYNKLTKTELQKYKNIILLAANSSVGSCTGHPKHSLKNNVLNFINLLNKLNKKQKLIYASSGSIYGNTEGNIVSEIYTKFQTVSYYDLTKYTSDCYAALSKVEYYGLRFGTVNGKIPESNIIRDDLIINAMTKNAILHKKITSINPEVNRGILGLNDLCESIKSIIESDTDNRGIYNLASFNSDVGTISNYIKDRFECEVDTKKDAKKKMYDFKLNTCKFKSVYNFEFKDTISTICDSIEKDFESIEFVRRDKCLKI
jgi:nucleoside-diphosphate-sugar epimerase